MYHDAAGLTLKREQFNYLLKKAGAEFTGPDGDKLRNRLFTCVDIDGNGLVSTKEVIMYLSKLTRGT